MNICINGCCSGVNCYPFAPAGSRLQMDIYLLYSIFRAILDPDFLSLFCYTCLIYAIFHVQLALTAPYGL